MRYNALKHMNVFGFMFAILWIVMRIQDNTDFHAFALWFGMNGFYIDSLKYYKIKAFLFNVSFQTQNLEFVSHEYKGKFIRGNICNTCI